MTVTVQGYGSRHHVDFGTPDGSRVFVLTGVVMLGFQGQSSTAYTRDTIVFDVPIQVLPPGKGLRVVHWAPQVGLASVVNEGPPMSLGWAVDSFWLLDTGPVIATASIGCELAVRDPGSYLYRLAYSLHLVGTIDDLPA